MTSVNTGFLLVLRTAKDTACGGIKKPKTLEGHLALKNLDKS
jgi:hypothetical protein